METRYVLDLNSDMSRVLMETDASGNATAYYIYGLGLLYKITPAGDRFHYHYDPIGSTLALTDTNENLTDTYAYDPFGKLINKTGSTANPFQYVGQYGVMNEENGLLFMRARFYDPETKRFLSRDPVKGDANDTLSLNYYAYTRGNPILYIDSDGELFFLAPIVIGAAAGAIGGAIWEGYRAYERHETGGTFWKSVAIGAGAGLVTGAIAGAGGMMIIAAIPMGVSATVGASAFAATANFISHVESYAVTTALTTSPDNISTVAAVEHGIVGASGTLGSVAPGGDIALETTKAVITTSFKIAGKASIDAFEDGSSESPINSIDWNTRKVMSFKMNPSPKTLLMGGRAAPGAWSNPSLWQ